MQPLATWARTGPLTNAAELSAREWGHHMPQNDQTTLE